jgi:hypothetical protein
MSETPEKSDLILELGEENRGYPCHCCGRPSHLVYALVYHEGNAHAVYLAGWSEGHREEGVRMVVSIGDWAEQSVPLDRLAVGLCCLLRGQQVRFNVVSPDRSPWGDFQYLGPMLSEADAVNHPYLEAFLDVARQAVREDARVREFLRRTSDHRP